MAQSFKFYRQILIVVAILAGTQSVSASDWAKEKAAFWPQWRGPEANGVSRLANPPIRWSEDQHVQWKVPLDGQGSSTPIIWQDKIFLLTSIDTGEVIPDLPKPADQPARPFGITYPNTRFQFAVICLDRTSGMELWRRIAKEMVPHEGHHGDNNFASASPVTDGRRLYVWFGSAGLYCYDLDGRLLWQRDLGPVNMRKSFGEGASPVVHGDRIVLVRDQEDQSYLMTLDARNGATVWRANRDEPSAWATPLIVEHQNKTQVITNASNRVRSYDLADGSILWECGGQVGNVTPSPVATQDTVFCMSGYRGSSLFALPLDSRGDISDSDHVTWSRDRGTPYVPSPLLLGGRLYFNQSNNPILSCVDAPTGRVVMSRTRLPAVRRLYASPVAAAGRLYLVGRDGAAVVIEPGGELKVLAINRLDEGCDASPALVGEQLFLRGSKHLYCLSRASR